MGTARHHAGDPLRGFTYRWPSQVARTPHCQPDTCLTGLYERLAARGHHVARFVEEIEARQPRAEEAEFLRLTEAQAVLEAARIVSDDGGQAVEAVMNVFSSQEWLPSYEWNASD